jgi:threonine synthase
MQYFSTKDRNHLVSFKEAVFRSLPPDNGLYFPFSIPDLHNLLSEAIKERDLTELCTEVIKHFVGEEIDEKALYQIVKESIDFPLPVREVKPGIHVLELFHGPTWAFKDVGARFLARSMGYFTRTTGEEVTILVATSGDTGGAVAAGFHKVPGTQVIILYPKGKVSEVQERQLTTLGHNITAYEVDGVFEDCQRMVKQAFLDEDLNSKYNLSSANSINVARLLPQMFYYFAMYQQLPVDDLVVAVPSGNYGNLTAGMFAKRMGLPLGKFIASSNVNKIIPEYLRTSRYIPRDSIQTYSNAMDVGDPSNFVRMEQLYDHDYQRIVKDVDGFWLDDKQTLEVMRQCYQDTGYILDPHGAIGYAACESYRSKEKVPTVFLETAHPVKFQPVLDKAFGSEVRYDEKTATLMDKQVEKRSISADFDAFKQEIL